ncbi:hypothetical protein BDZ91DRAFT_562423 [Kalaharituber pfeilii]|nr:hypothetical protein BDZ91DRAFT_562423 [Kalaharituber pfeilii]
MWQGAVLLSSRTFHQLGRPTTRGPTDRPRQELAACPALCLHARAPVSACHKAALHFLPRTILVAISRRCHRSAGFHVIQEILRL